MYAKPRVFKWKDGHGWGVVAVRVGERWGVEFFDFCTWQQAFNHALGLAAR